MLVLYLFIPGATAVFAAMGIAAISGRATALQIAVYRFGLMLTAAVACYAFEGARVVLTVWLLFCLPGAALLIFSKKALDSSALYKMTAAFKVSRFVWRGFGSRAGGRVVRWSRQRDTPI
ncbi:hypothetical protein [Rhizobium sp. BK060]|uniref:hypothetical protein n=1 Tax=Rhizobium sp. BK060 TaxID=2587096 RepID=UPI00161E097B|nr:hypothetical protein [Rhizobium sp. BK060]MBB3398119.1 hypothetical protein [Rhizobium sp. BK060]